VVVSNYCFHELCHAEKQLALSEAMRVMRPGGRLVIGDMMFSLNPIASRDRQLVIGKVRAIARRGLPGAWRLLKNVARLLTGRWEHPASAAWWSDALHAAGFERVHIETCAHEGGIAVAYAPPTKDVDERRVSLPHGSELSEASRATSPPALSRTRAAAMRLT
jgi:hypothetical protein